MRIVVENVRLPKQRTNNTRAQMTFFVVVIVVVDGCCGQRRWMCVTNPITLEDTNEQK